MEGFFQEGQFSLCCDWFEGTLWPDMAIDDFVFDFCSCVFPDKDFDRICTWVNKGWLGYSGRCIIGGTENLIQFFYRADHPFSHSPGITSGDFSYVSAQYDGNGNLISPVFDVHIVVTGSGLRYMGNDGALRMMSYFRKPGYQYEEGSLPQFAYEFKPTRIDMAFDVFEDNGFVSSVSDAFQCEYNHSFLPDYKGVNRLTSNAMRRSLNAHMQCGSTNWTWGSRGKSNFYFRLYDKKLEQNVKNGPLKGRHAYWWRFEYETRLLAALNCAIHLIYNNSVLSAMSYCFNNFFTVVEDSYNDSNCSRNPVSSFWADFLSFLNDSPVPVTSCIVVEPYTIIHLVQSKKMRCKQDILLAYIADPHSFSTSEGQALLDRLRSDPRYFSVMRRLDHGILTIDDVSLIESLPVSRGVSSFWTIDF